MGKERGISIVLQEGEKDEEFKGSFPKKVK